MDFWKAIGPMETDIARHFAGQMKAYLDADYKEISFEDIWLESPPSDAEGQPLADFLNNVCRANMKGLYVDTNLLVR